MPPLTPRKKKALILTGGFWLTVLLLAGLARWELGRLGPGAGDPWLAGGPGGSWLDRQDPAAASARHQRARQAWEEWRRTTPQWDDTASAAFQTQYEVILRRGRAELEDGRQRFRAYLEKLWGKGP
ncbi:MAG: hypothetical protein GX442_10215 [Candidatus Riflebacteria bacterium]|nr:hypothetical protein [Candidatus Riflebacteria bacterium]